MSAASFFSRASDARSISPIGFIGEFIRSHEFVSITGVNQHPQAAQVTTITIPAGPANSTAYSVIANGVVTASFTTDAAATQDELGDGLAAAWNAQQAGGFVEHQQVLVFIQTRRTGRNNSHQGFWWRRRSTVSHSSSTSFGL